MHPIVQVVVAAGLLTRWIHMARTLRRRGPPPVGRGEWQAVALGLAYGAALVLWLSGLVSGLPLDRPGCEGVTAVGLLLPGVALRVWGLEALGPAFQWGAQPVARELVTVGPYRVMRHPLLAGYTLEVAALTVASGYRGSLAWVPLALAGLCSWVAARKEERLLRERHGNLWVAWAAGKLL
jgi:protein-S-isoprenylcysteine O-methyltransferase Ste14